MSVSMVEDGGKTDNLRTRHGSRASGLLFALAVFVVALAFRGWRIAEIQPTWDESTAFGFNRGEPLRWAAVDGGRELRFTESLGRFLSTFYHNAELCREGSATPMWCVLAESFRFIAGENYVAARWFHAVLHSIGVALFAFLGWNIFSPRRPPAVAAASLAVFSVVSVFYGQFGDSYAYYFLAPVILYCAYWFLLRGRWSSKSYFLFALIAYLLSLLDYLELWVLLGLLLASLWEKGEVSRARRLSYALGSLALFAILSLVPFYMLMTHEGLEAGYRLYLWNYYPQRCLDLSGSAFTCWIRYYLKQTYDLFNYHVSLVFSPAWYRPLCWNWLSFPFLMILFAAAVLWGIRALKEFIQRNPLSVIRYPSREDDHGSRITDHGPRITDHGLRITDYGSRVTDPGSRQGTGIMPMLFSVLLVYIIANRLFLIPYGGVRNSLFLAPLIWLAYGAAVNILLPSRPVHRFFYYLLATVLIGLTLLPLAFSLPSFYRERVSRIDFRQLGKLIDESQADTLIMPQVTYNPFRMLLQRHPEFADRYLKSGRVKLRHFSEFEHWEEWPLPIPEGKVLAVDFYQSSDGRFEGLGITKDHPTLSALCGPSWILEPLLEIPGPHLEIKEHQSIYYPPNSFFVYILLKKSK